MRALFALLAFVALASLAAGQSRTDTYDAASARGTHVELDALPDGGCSIRVACAELHSQDGGGDLTGCASFEPETGSLANSTNRTRCAVLLELGARRYTRALRFAVDAGG